jgi:hypothetical protein
MPLDVYGLSISASRSFQSFHQGFSGPPRSFQRVPKTESGNDLFPPVFRAGTTGATLWAL